MFYVYALMDPINKLPFYIGKGSGNRINDHFREEYNPKNYKSRVIQNIRNLGFELRADIIYETADEDDAFAAELLFIHYCRDMRIPLTNVLGYTRNHAKIGRKWSPEAIARRSETARRTGCRRGRKISEQQRQRLREVNLGKEGPNKVYINLDELREIYLIRSFTKKQVLKHFNIGMGSLNRILNENNIVKLPRRILKK